MLMRRVLMVSLLLAALAAVAGATDLGLAEHWRAPGITSPMFKKIVVVGIIHDAPTRRRFEDRFVSLLRARNFEGITSYSLVPDLANVPDPDKVVETVLANQVDGVFTVRMEPLADQEAEDAWPAAWRADVVKEGRVRDYVSRSIARPLVETKRYGAEVSVWEVASGRRLWAAHFQPLKRKTLQKNAGTMSQDVMNQLIFEKLF